MRLDTPLSKHDIQYIDHIEKRPYIILYPEYGMPKRAFDLIDSEVEVADFLKHCLANGWSLSKKVRDEI